MTCMVCKKSFNEDPGFVWWCQPCWDTQKPSRALPLIFHGYTGTARDGGIQNDPMNQTIAADRKLLARSCAHCKKMQPRFKFTKSLHPTLQGDEIWCNECKRHENELQDSLKQFQSTRRLKGWEPITSIAIDKPEAQFKADFIKSPEALKSPEEKMNKKRDGLLREFFS